MASSGTWTFTVTSGTPGSVSGSGATLVDGTYSVTVTQDNTGVTIVATTPYGEIQQDSFPKGDDIQ